MIAVGLGSSSWALGISVAVFTLFSGFASSFLLVLYVRNGQVFNYISILAIAITLDKFNSFAQQLYSLFNFAEIQLKAYQMAVEYFRCRGEESLPLFASPDEAVSVFFQIQWFLVNAQGLLFFYWSLILFSSAWALSPAWWKNKWAVIGTKISCLALPLFLLGLLRIPAIQDSDIANLVIQNMIVLVNIGMSSVFLLLTLIYVISVHRETRGATEVRLSKQYDGVIEFRPRRQDCIIREKPVKKGLGGFVMNSDGWLIGRIALAFVMVEGLQIYVIIMQIFFLNRWGHFKDEWQQGLSAPIIDRAEEFANICSPIPSSFTGFLFLLVFGSTQESRAQAKTLFADVRVFITGKKPPPELPTWKSNHRGTIGQFRAEAQTTRRLNKNRASDISSLFNTDRLSPVSTNGNGSVISGNGVDSSTSNIHARLHRGPPRPLTIITLPESSRIRDSPCSLSIAGLGSANTTDQEINFFTFNSRWNLGGTNPPTSAASASPLSLLSSASYSPLLGSGVNSGLDRTSYPTPTMSPSKSIIDSGREREREGAWWNSLAGRGMSPISPLPPARIVLGNEMMRGGYGDIGDSMEGAGNGGRAANGGGENSSNGGGFRGRAGIDTVRKDNRDI